MAKKQRSTEGESVPLAPEVSPPPVAHAELYGPKCLACGTTANDFALLAERAIADARAGLPIVTGHGITQALSPKGWVAFRCTTGGNIKVLTPAAANGAVVGESKASACARLRRAIEEEYA